MTEDTLGTLADPAAMLDASVPCRTLSAMFRTDPSLRSVVIDRGAGNQPALINRGAFYQVMAGPRGYGWALFARKRVSDVIADIPACVTLPAHMPIEEAGLAVLTREDVAASDDLLVIHEGGSAAPIAVSVLLAELARSYQQRVTDVSQAHQRFRSLLHASSGTVVVTDADGHITYCSPQVAEWVGLDDDSLLLGIPVQDLIHADDRETAEHVVTSLRGEPHSYMRIFFRVRRYDGKLRWMEGTARNLLHDEAVAGLVFNFLDVTGRHRAEQELRRQAFHDSLTELPNRAVLRTEGDRMLATARDSGSLVAAFLIDLDRFKDINDYYGHVTGDALLVQVAARLKEAVGSTGIVGRLGGDEFLALVEGDVLADGPEPIAEEMLARVRQPVLIGERSLSPTASIGIAYGPRSDSGELLRDADIALYEAKGTGRDRQCIFTPTMKERVEKRAWTEANLVGVLERQELELHYQPGVRLADMNLTHTEALLRWRHPERGLIQPADFIATLEDSGQIVPVGRWVLLESCRAVATLHAEGHRLRASVNVSPRQLGPGSTLMSDVAHALETSGLPAHYLCLEITENTLLGDAALIHDQLHELKTLGIALAVDDFGVGYSSLSYLATLPFDVIKIDRSFVSQLGQSPQSELVLQSVLNLGQALSVTTVGEGVELSSQLDHLRNRGCHFGQGFLFARPMPLTDFLSFLDCWGPTGGYFSPPGANLEAISAAADRIQAAARAESERRPVNPGAIRI